MKRWSPFYFFFFVQGLHKHRFYWQNKNFDRKIRWYDTFPWGWVGGYGFSFFFVGFRKNSLWVWGLLSSEFFFHTIYDLLLQIHVGVFFSFSTGSAFQCPAAIRWQPRAKPVSCPKHQPQWKAQKVKHSSHSSDAETSSPALPARSLLCLRV